MDPNDLAEVPPVGFELQNMEAGRAQPPPPPQQQLYPALGGNGAGPTPVETVPSDGPGSVTSATGVNPAGLEARGHDDDVPEVFIANEKLERLKKRETLFFKNGKSRIDYILAYKEPQEPEQEKERKTFEKNLLAEGMELEYTDKRLSQDGKTTYVKVHAPWEVLTRMAELLNMKMPIKIVEPEFVDSVRQPRKASRSYAVEEKLEEGRSAPQEYDIGEGRKGCLERLRIDNPMVLSDDLLKPEPDYFTADFNRERADMFIIEDKDTFFNNAQRSLCVNQLLLRTHYNDDKNNKFGIDKLIKHGSYDAAYPLHEGKYTSDHSILLGSDNDRHLLYETWAKPGRWYFYQPLDLIRKYYGEKIAIYFAWLGFYTSMLIPASIVGVIVFIYGCATVFSNQPSEDICDENGAGNFTMCPLCDGRCTYWKLHTSCNYSRLTYLFDNPGTVFFAGFMAIWATMFLEFWKRQQAELQYDWDVAGFQFEERMRPEFEAKCNEHQKLNPITQLMEPFLPLYYKIPRRCTSIAVVVFMVVCVLAAVFGVIMYRIIIVAVLYASDQDLIRQNAKITTTATAALISLVVIMILNKLYERVAFWLTEFEHPRTDTEYDNSYTFKMFLFQFINFYGTIFYIAFFKGRFIGYPADYYYIFSKYRMQECDPAGCLIELCIQLGIVMVGKQAFNNFKEILMPKILNWLRAWRARKETKENLYTRWEQDHDLSELRPMGLFEEYLEMVIQYGFVTIFVAAFPLAPLFALLNNVIEIRLDAYKFVTQWKRPVAVRAEDIGIWFGILQGVSFMAVLSNAFIIGWTSDFIPKLVYKAALSESKSLDGYLNYSLSYFDVKDFQRQSIPDEVEPEFGVVRHCRYADLRHPPWHEEKYEFTSDYWHTFCARLAFVIVFEHAIFFLTWLVMYLIPDMPGEVKQLMLREVHLAKEARYTAAFANIGEDKRKRMESEAKTA